MDRQGGEEPKAMPWYKALHQKHLKASRDFSDMSRLMTQKRPALRHTRGRLLNHPDSFHSASHVYACEHEFELFNGVSEIDEDGHPWAVYNGVRHGQRFTVEIVPHLSTAKYKAVIHEAQM